MNLGELLVKIINTQGGGGGDSLPIGSIELWSNDVAPNGWLICDGSAISRTTYSDLFDVIGTTFGAGDGSTTFNLPNLKDRFAVGVGDNYDLGDVGGEATHTLATNEMPAHAHHDLHEGLSYWVPGLVPSGSSMWALTASGSKSADVYTGNTGGGQPHNNMPPYLALHYIIKVQNLQPEAPLTLNAENNQILGTEDSFNLLASGDSEQGVKISELPSSTGITDATLIPIVNDDTEKATFADIRTATLNSAFHIEIVNIPSPTASWSYSTATAPTVSGYQFIAWLGCSTIGYIGSAYCENVGNSTTNVFDPFGAGGHQIRCVAFYSRVS